MHITVLGRYGPYPAAGGRCSGYLVEHEETRILLDCGSGVLSHLLGFLKPWKLDAIIVSHLHTDHISDILITAYSLLPHSGGERKLVPLPVYAPPNPEKELNRIAAKDTLAVTAVCQGEELQVGRVKITFDNGIHSVPSHLISLTAGGAKMVYSGDTEFFPELSEIAYAADIFLCEASYSHEEIEKGYSNHMSAFQAASAALEANVKKLLLTHLHPEKDESLILEEAKAVFSNSELAVEGERYSV